MVNNVDTKELKDYIDILISNNRKFYLYLSKNKLNNFSEETKEIELLMEICVRDYWKLFHLSHLPTFFDDCQKDINEKISKLEELTKYQDNPQYFIQKFKDKSNLDYLRIKELEQNVEELKKSNTYKYLRIKELEYGIFNKI